jgi:hypothetical protein
VSFLVNPTPPRLPDPEEELSPSAWRALLLVLRLYFSQLNNFTQSASGRNGGRFFEVPTASYYADTAQAFPVNTATPVEFPLFTNEQGFTKPSLSKFSPDYAGTYRLTVRLTLRNTHAPDETVNFWVRKNATDIPTSTVQASVPSNGFLSVTMDYLLDLLPTDTLEIIIFASSAFIALFANAAAGAVPRGAAARININYASNNSEADIIAPLFRLKKKVFDPLP